MRKRLTREERIFVTLGKFFAMILFSIPYVVILLYGLTHATTLK